MHVNSLCDPPRFDYVDVLKHYGDYNLQFLVVYQNSLINLALIILYIHNSITKQEAGIDVMGGGLSLW